MSKVAEGEWGGGLGRTCLTGACELVVRMSVPSRHLVVVLKIPHFRISSDFISCSLLMLCKGY